MNLRVKTSLRIPLLYFYIHSMSPENKEKMQCIKNRIYKEVLTYGFLNVLSSYTKLKVFWKKDYISLWELQYNKNIKKGNHNIEMVVIYYIWELNIDRLLGDKL